MVTVVSVVTSSGVYVFPEILPPPETTDQLPPAGVANNVLVDVSQMAVEVVVLLAVPENGFTVKVTSEVVAAQEPLAATV